MWTLQRIHMLSQRHHRRRRHFLPAVLKLENLSLLMVGTTSTALKLAQW